MKIGLIGAMEEEVQALKDAMEGADVAVRAGMEFHSGMLWGLPAVVVKSGIGKVNAGICTQILADIYGVDAVINTGVAGSLDARIDIGDLVLSTDVLQHDMDATGFGYPVGVIPQMAESDFKADSGLIELAETCSRRACPEIGIFRGRIVSGDQFVSDKAKKDWLVSQFGGLCTEMEGAAIGQAAYLNGIPFLIIRAISDKADDSASVSYDEFYMAAVKNSVRLLKEIFATICRTGRGRE
ncbi:MAG: 5'-methylthioadenosine/adenosylhomocysteine nucleosidase [Lachnospiraceae bacterium]|nr:5'-methylthioadenosine/adenosylhomocysteine nucleosidase [Lachnospiraceae bacterium]